MNTIQLTAIIDRISQNTHFLGVLPCDHLPKESLRTLPTSAIINTHPSHLPGEHWLAIYINKDGSAFFFDSFGNSPDFIRFPASIIDFLKNNSTSIQYSAKQVQHFMAVTCGHHCVFFLYHMIRGRDYDDIMMLYSDDLIKNDKFVSCFVKKLRISHCNSTTSKCIQCVQMGETFMLNT